MNDPQALADLMEKRGIGLEEIGGLEGLTQWLRQSRTKYKCRWSRDGFPCEPCANHESTTYLALYGPGYGEQLEA